ncbi:MAG: MATE family efflux transporter [Burkholderiaceae bacterium]|nr:MATE family efflux transporter [Burkholderiaceae bacterium]
MKSAIPDTDASARDGAQARSPWRVLRLAAPIIVSNLSVPLVGLVDTAVMGRLPDPAFIGAVALGAVLFSYIYWGFGFLRMGTTGFVARAFGAGDGDAIRALAARSLLLAAGLGATVLLLQWPIGMLGRVLMPASDGVETAMLEYYGVRVWSAPAVLANYVLMGVFIGMQRTGFAVIAQLVLNLGNAALSAWFVLRLDWGIGGVALASVVAEYASLVVGVLLLMPAIRRVPGHWPVGRLLLSARGYRELVVVNGNLFLRTLCLITAFAWFNAQSAALGDLNLAVNAVLLQLLHLLSYGLDGFAHAAETLVGSALGARDARAYRWAIRSTTGWALGTALVYSALYAALGSAIVALLTTIEPVRSLAADYLPWLVAMPVVAVWSYQLDGIFVGSLRSADMRNSMGVALIAYLLASLVARPALGNHGLWLGLAVFFVARALTLARVLRRQPDGESPQAG